MKRSEQFLALGGAIAMTGLVAQALLTMPAHSTAESRVADAFAPFGAYAGVVRSGKSDLASLSGLCDRTWPNVPQACRINAAGRDLPRATRTITVEHRMADRSILVRVPTVEMAQR
jgi:hypothetical protein